MKSDRQQLALDALRWTLGVIILLESIHFTLSASITHHFAAAGFPQWIRPLLGITEIVAAILLLVPGTISAGGGLLLAVFAAAILFHWLNHEFDVGALVIYSAAVIVCMTHQSLYDPSKREGAE